MSKVVFSLIGIVSSVNWWEESSLSNARSLAMVFDRESRRHNVYREGNLLMSDSQLEFYFEIARAPWIKTICETGFNAGHSAAVFLNANPHARVISFDLGQFDYTLRNLRLMKEMFPDRGHMDICRRACLRGLVEALLAPRSVCF